MATDTHRTPADEAVDALIALADMEREIGNLRAHLVRLKAEPAPGIAQQAHRSARLIAARAEEARAYSCEAARLADSAAASSSTPLRSVS
jgi:cell division septation protein DedD